MRHDGTRKNSADACAPAFTLIEVVVSLTILAVVAAIAIPTLKGLDAGERARAPMRELADLVQQTRQRALREGRSYQIVIEREGIHASRTLFPFETRDEFLKFLEELRTPPRPENFERESVQRTEVVREQTSNVGPVENQPGQPADEPHWVPPWTVTIPLEQGMECEVLMWGDGEWDVIEGGKMRRWVFQPTGMANPARIRLRTAAVELEAGFDVLTGELVGERALPSAKPK
jgi:prepilin-type N-terminal cleavage/methylation domain-containing protein